jgi:hypothetical protein
MNQYDNMTEAVKGLQERGYNYDFNLDSEKICAGAADGKFSPEEFKIVEFYRFEGPTDPSESSVVYAIESEKNKLKGYMVNAYGIYSDAHTDEFISKLDVVHQLS